MRAHFQEFTTPITAPKTIHERLEALRAWLSAHALDGMLLPRADIFQGEYLPACEERMRWLTGFNGSAGFGIVLAEHAALFVDGRYDVQARAELAHSPIAVVPLAQQTPQEWLKTHLPPLNQPPEDTPPLRARIGYDPYLFAQATFSKFEKAAAAANFTLVPLTEDPFATLWPERPALPQTPVIDHPLALSGANTAEKLAAIRTKLATSGIDGLLISDTPNVNWLFNLRAQDIPHVPVLRAFAYVPSDPTAKPILCADPQRLAPDLRARLTREVTLIPPTPSSDGRAQIAALLREYAAGFPQPAPGAQDNTPQDNTPQDTIPQDTIPPHAPQTSVPTHRPQKIRLDADTAPLAFGTVVEHAGGIADYGPDPIALLKACKNPVERAGARAAHQRDGVAMVRFLAAFEAAQAAGTALDEIGAACLLEQARARDPALRDLSFPTISAAGPNAALPHYRVSEASNRPLEPGLFLIDSGGQYPDGTTDITRTLAIGAVPQPAREAYTLVLKGMIALSQAVFPKNTSGAQLDTLARQFLWQYGLDFDHGTGHGVGSYLSVHEGPQRISKLGTVPLEAGMILSNEPGYYREGAFGIRIENLLLVEPRTIPGAEREMLGFETLTLCPIDTRPLLPDWLNKVERDWLNAYHRKVLETLAPLLDGQDRQALERMCLPL